MGLVLVPTYAGRLGNKTQTLLFGGINSEASIANIRDGEAADILNWDLLPGGAIQLRSGYVPYQNLGGTGRMLDRYVKYDGTEVYIAVSNGKLWASSTPSGAWSDISPSPAIIDSSKPWVGANFGDNYYLANGDNQPFFIKFGFSATSLKNQSQLQSPTSLSVQNIGTSGATSYQYAVTAVTGRGETTPSFISTTTGNVALSATNYNLLNWVPQLGDNGGYNIYRFDSGSSSYRLIGLVVSQTSSFQDTGQPFVQPIHNPPVSNGAFNTPLDWDQNGYPQGFGVLSRGAGGRIIAWRNNLVWVSALNNPLDWYGSGAFNFFLDGAQDNRVRAVFTIYDFTVFTTSTNSFFVAGNSASNLQVVKIQGTGCISPHSAVQVGNDVYIWSQFGPTSLQRVLQGQDVQYAPIAEKIKSMIRDTSEVSAWPNIVGYNDIFKRRVIWTYPATGSQTNTGAFVFYYTTGGWTKYGNYPFAGVATSDDNTQIWGLSSTGTINQLDTGTTDAGSAIAGTYNGPWYDMGNWDMRRVLWQDLLVDSTDAPYTFTVNVAWDWGRPGYTETHTVTATTVDGNAVPWGGSFANFYRIPTTGVGQSIQFSFNVTSSTNAPKIIGWRVEGRAKGARVS